MRKVIVIAALLAGPQLAFSADGTARREEAGRLGERLNSVGKAEISAAARQLALPEPAAGQEKIVGGVEAEAGEFPFMVSLRGGYGGHFCGGSLIKKDWVLTAAHCVPAGIKTVVAGLYDQSQEQGAEKFEADKVIQHPQYNTRPQDYDFALVHLKGESRFAPVKLNPEELSGTPDLVTAGWGYTEENGEIPNVLRKVTVPLVTKEACSAAYQGQITDRMLCAGFPEGGKDSCQGDSGGPLLAGSGPARTLVGVVSWGQGCARPNKYGVYSKVSSVLPWIKKTIR